MHNNPCLSDLVCHCSPKGDAGIHDPSPINGYDKPLEKVEMFRSTVLSLSVPNDYAEPIFDDNHKPLPSNCDYSVPHDGLVKKSSQLGTKTSGHFKRRSDSFVQPAASMKLLVTQIKETMVKKILPESIWYVQ